VLLSSGRFFVRRIPVAPDSPVAAQVELALETLSPFPPAQLFHGYVLEEGGREALIFASHRRNYTAEETAGWSNATAVLPGFAPWLSADNLPAAGLGWRQQADSIEVLAWDGRSRLPQVVLARMIPTGESAAALRPALLEEARQRAGLASGCPVRELPTTIGTTPGKNGEIVLTLSGQPVVSVRFDSAHLDLMDVRDKAQLSYQRRTARRDLWLWRACVAGGAGLAACLLLELALVGGNLWLRGIHTLINARAEPVAQIKSTQELATRVGEMSSAQLRPLEMLTLVNAQRPPAVTFVRMVTTGVRSLEIEAQTGNPGDLRDLESKLKALTDVDRVELRDPRSRDGQTSFVLEVSFKPGYLPKGGGA
jgi:hypothetical protein